MISRLLLPAALVLLAQAPQQQEPARIEPAGIPVRYSEGTVHGFLELSTAEGTTIAEGDLLQIHKGRGIESRMVFRFRDSSYFEETVSFTQREVFMVQSYHLVQRGPAFAQDLDASLERPSGTYHVVARDHGNGEEKTWDGTMELPPDVYNGLVITLLKNLGPNETQTVHLVAFTPKPRLIRLELAPVGTQRILNGQRGETTVQFRLKPRLGPLVGFFARLTGKMPPDSHAWIVTTDVPAFVRFQGPLYSGPVWRIDLSSPRWPR